MTIWSVEAFFVIPLGALCLTLLLSDIQALQKISMSICSVRISLGSFQVTLSFLFALFATTVFLFQSFSTLRAERMSFSPNQTVEAADRLRMKEWRNDRNWWISLFACTVWLLCWRIQVWTKRYCLTESSSPPPATQQPSVVPVQKTKTLKKND